MTFRDKKIPLLFDDLLRIRKNRPPFSTTRRQHRILKLLFGEKSQIVNYSTTTEAGEKIKVDLKSSRFSKYYGVGCTKFINNQILLKIVEEGKITSSLPATFRYFPPAWRHH